MKTTTDISSPRAPLAVMTKLSSSVFLHRPISNAEGDMSHPGLVLICGWMNARDAHLVKYINEYQARYPATAILLLKSRTAIMVSPHIARSDVAPAIPTIKELLSRAHGAKPQPGTKILVHAFSNGGSCLLSALNESYHDPKGVSSSLPPHVTIFDSAPSTRFDRRAVVTALLAGVPAGIIRTLILPFLKLVSWFWSVRIRLLRGSDSMVALAASHNDKSKVRETGRTYIYSDGDALVNYREVEEHARAAEQNGFRVKKEMFAGSPHVAHARTDAVRYWKIIEDAWNER